MDIPESVPLPRSPLVRVIAQVRFPPILSIAKADCVAEFQERIRAEYPHLQKEISKNIIFGASPHEQILEETIWRFGDQPAPTKWRVSLSTEFVALETADYPGHEEFMARLREVLTHVAGCFDPASAERIGIRYIDLLRGSAIPKLSDLFQPGLLGTMEKTDTPNNQLGKAVIHSMNQFQLQTVDGVVMGRWGKMPANTSYAPNLIEPIPEPSWFLDLDMGTQTPTSFQSEGIAEQAKIFSRRIYAVFREMVTDEFMKFYGGAI